MKYFRYILFLVLISFAFLVNVNAEEYFCEYKSNANNGVKFTFDSDYNLSVEKIGEADGLSITTRVIIRDFLLNNKLYCPDNIYYSTKINNSDKTTKTFSFIKKNEDDSKVEKSDSNISDAESPKMNKKIYFTCLYEDYYIFYFNDNTLLASSYDYDVTFSGDQTAFQSGCIDYVYVNKENTSNQVIVSAIPNDRYTKIAREGLQVGGNNNSKPSSSNGSGLDLENFCTGSIQGVFTTLGWVIYIIKIIIPLLLIVFGTIELTKVILAGKEEDMKKATKTLVLRAVVGIIIFFMPVVLNAIVNMIEATNIYKGKFLDCTKCMLDPTNEEECKGLGED